MPDIGLPIETALHGVQLAPGSTIEHDNSAQTLAEIQRAIAEAGGRIPFSKFMAIALYGEYGYYSTGQADIRAYGVGEFYTFPQISTDLCEAMGNVALKVWEAMGRPQMDYIEEGAGTGAMITDIMTWMRQMFPEMYALTSFNIVEIGDMERHQRKTIGGLQDPKTTALRGSRAEKRTPEECAEALGRVQWHRQSAVDFTVDEDRPTIVETNELPDAFEVEEVRNVGGLQQKYVSWDSQENKPVTEWGPLQPEVQAYIDRFGITVEERHAIAVNLNAVKWLRNLGKSLTRGAIVIVDYGEKGPMQRSLDEAPQTTLFEALRLEPRDQYKGAVRTFPRGHDPVEFPGQLDITSDVDFTVLAEVAEEMGLQVAFDGTQSELMEACGVPSSEELAERYLTKLDNLDRDSEEAREFARNLRIRIEATQKAYRHKNFRALVLTTAGIEVDFTTPQPLLESYRGLIDRP